MTCYVMESVTPAVLASRYMPLPITPKPSPNHPGELLREWRTARRLSQLELALDADVSTRYLSCVETGKSRPSREMIERLSEALAVPLRERNALFAAMGYAPAYPESALRNKEMNQIRRAVDLIIKHQEPYPAFVFNRYWEITQTNQAAVRLADFLIGGSAHSNMLHQFFDPNDLRRAVTNWEEVASDLLRHVHHALAANPFDTRSRELLEQVLAYPGVPSHWNIRERSEPPAPILTVEFRKGNETLRFFSTFTTFGTSRDVTVEELQIECTFPADDQTAGLCRQLADKP